MTQHSKRPQKTVRYQDHLLQRLQNPIEAAAYLNAALEDADPHVFLIALRDVTTSIIIQKKFSLGKRPKMGRFYLGK